MVPEIFPPIPADTVEAARSVFGRRNFYLATGDQVNSLFSGMDLVNPFGREIYEPRTIAMLYLITIFQFVEALPDERAADALRLRVDWKYALHLPVNYSGLKVLPFCKFRRDLLNERAAKQNLQALIERLSEIKMAIGKSLYNLSSDDLIQNVCLLSRLAQLWETMCQALEILAAKDPEWLRKVNLPYWYKRYGNHRKTINLAAESSKQIALAESIGADGFHLLAAVSEAEAQSLAHLPEVGALKDVWADQFEFEEGQITWKTDACISCLNPH